MALLEVDDLTPFATIADEKAEAMVASAIARAILLAPCLEDEDELTENQIEAARSVLRDAVLRWAEAGSGAVASQAWGSYSQTLDTRQTRRALFWPSEIKDLQLICKGGEDSGGVFAIDTAAPPMQFRNVLGTGVSGTVGAIAFDSDDPDWFWQ